MGNTSSCRSPSQHSVVAPPSITLNDVMQKCGAIPVTSRYETSRDIKCDYNVGPEILGKGANGAVVLATDKNNGRGYAVKTLKKSTRSDREVAVYLLLDHPHIARLERVYKSEENIHLIMECMGGGELLNRVKKSNWFSESRASRALQQMLSAVAYLHAQHVVHRDLKLDNFLCKDHECDYIKLIDFGFATVWDGCTKMSERLGTTLYAAPESFDGCYTEKADMWAMGVIAFMMLTGSTPFGGKNNQERMKNIKRGLRDPRTLPLFEQLSDGAQNFVNSLLAIDPAKRLSAVDALQHPWICNCGKATASPDSAEVLHSLQQYKKASSFRRACLSVMAWSLPLKDQTKMSAFFRAIDVNSNGTIELTELVNVLCEGLGLSKDEACTIFRYLDANNDQKITFNELLAATLKVSKDALQEAFRRFDANNRGVITHHDVNAILGEPYSNLMHEADYNGDGEISYAEFERYMLSQVDEAQVVWV